MSIDFSKIPARFEIIKELGSGGMAKVFLAKDKEKEKLVAIKTLLNDSNAPSANRHRFKEEMRLAKDLSSPYIVRFYEGKYNNEIQYIVMEYVDGKMLKEIIETNGRLNPVQVVDYGCQIAKGFSEIHNKKIIHRDLKTSNIMITNNNEVKIIDFGIAIGEGTARYTQDNKVIGSVQYMAPELLDKEDATPQSDIYALGIILYEMLIGTPPHKGKNALETAMKHKNEDIKMVNELITSIPQALANVVAKATAKKKENRYKTMNELCEDLETCLKSTRSKEKPYNPNDNSKKGGGIFNKLFRKKEK